MTTVTAAGRSGSRATIRSALIGTVSLFLAAVMLASSMFGLMGRLKDLMYRHTQPNAGASNQSPVPPASVAGDDSVVQVELGIYLNTYYRGEYDPEDPDPAFLAAALYRDGSVTVACGESYRDDYAAVARWKNVRKICVSGSRVIALTRFGDVLVAGPGYDGKKPLYTEVRDILTAGYSFFALDAQGRIVNPTQEDWEPGLKELTDIQKIEVLNAAYSNWGFLVLHGDGTTTLTGYNGPASPFNGLTGVKDIGVLESSPVALKEDGTVLWGGGEAEGLSEIRMPLAMYDYYLFAATQSGQLQISGDFEEDARKYDLYTVPQQKQYRYVKEVTSTEDMRFGIPAVLYENGTVYCPQKYVNNLVSEWTDIKTLAWYEDYDHALLYGLRKDGTVLAVKTDGGSAEDVSDRYKDWVVEDLYVSRFSGCVGVCADGSFVGAHAFENLDLSTLEKAK